MCYKNKFYGISSHRCVQMTPTLKCNQNCLFCWRSMEHEVVESEECLPEVILKRIPPLQKKALAGYNPSADMSKTDPALWEEALSPNMIAISLSGEPTLYSKLPELINMLNEAGNTTFLVSNGTRPEMIERCHPYQTYISLDAPDRETYLKICRPEEDYWDNIQKSLSLLGERRSAVRTTVVKGINDFLPENYAAMYQDSGASFIEVKGYMYLGYSRFRLQRENMPEHPEVRDFALEISKYCDYKITDESPISRVVCMERR